MRFRGRPAKRPVRVLPRLNSCFNDMGRLRQASTLSRTIMNSAQRLLLNEDKSPGGKNFCLKQKFLD